MTEFPSRRQLHGKGKDASPAALAPAARSDTQPMKRRRRAGRPRLLTGLIPLLVIVAAVAVVGAVLGTAAWLQAQQRLPQVQHLEGVFDHIHVGGRPGAPPVVTVDRPIQLASSKQTTIVTGDGREVVADSPVLLGIYQFSAEDGSSLPDVNQPQLVTGLATDTDLGADLTALVVGRTEGSRLVVVRPSENGTQINVIDVLPLVADGVEVEDASGPLEVEMTDAGPKITHGKTAPTGLTVQTLLEGSGAQVRSGDTVLLQYLTQRWGDDSVVGTTWGNGIPERIVIDQAMPGVRNALLDRKVGSRLAVVIPPDEATGDDTLIAVADILGTGPSE